jgi:hypothetical protein
MVAAFVSYSHKDEEMRDQLEIHLAMLKREGIIDVWHDRRILAGDDLDDEISAALEEAVVILLLVSPDFLASDYCYKREMGRALQRHDAHEARVIPVILRACEWQRAPIGKLRATPTDGKPIRKWPDIDEAFQVVVRDIRAAVGEVAPAKPTLARSSKRATVEAKPSVAHRDIRSSNLRIRKHFSEADRNRFVDEAFEYIANFFEGSMRELQDRHPEIETAFKRIDTHRFIAVVYRDGDAASRCRITLGGGAWSAGGITFSQSDDPNGTSFNENLIVEEGEQMLVLRPLGMPAFVQPPSSNLTHEGAAEYYWSLFIEPLQR